MTKRKRSRWPLYPYIYEDIKLRFTGSDGWSGKESKMRRRTVINAKIPRPNDNVAMTMGNKALVDAVFSDTGLDVFLDSLKRSQGESVSSEVKALVSNSAEMTGISINRLDRMLSDDIVRREYGLGNADVRSIYRTVERIGKRSDVIVSFIGDTVRRSYGVGMNIVFMGWTSMVFRGPSEKHRQGGLFQR